MSATLYQNELTSLASEAKRKFPDIRTAAEKALQDLKAITVTSEQQLAADLRRRPEFIDAFLKSCSTGNTKLAISGVNALQRLIISEGLPVSRLNEALQAFNACAELGLDVQLKVLQALPSLVQNYSEALRGDLLGSALQVCGSLQGAKVSTISAVAAATLQQLVAAVFTRVTEEDARGDIATVATVPGEDGNISVRPAAYDAYRIFRDLALAAEGRSTQFVQLTTLSKEDCLELIASCIQAKPQLINTHEELSKIIRSSIVNQARACLTENLSFTRTVRCIRILRLLILWYFTLFQAELEPAISLFTHTMEAESSPVWKRVLVMELVRDMFVESGLMIKVYVAFDQAEGGKAVVQDILAAFVRLSSEKPALIGLGQHSTAPLQSPTAREITAEQLVADPVGGVAGMLSSFGVTDTNSHGISSQWSVPKSPCYDQLDKTQPPTLPDTYIYSLVLDSLSGLSDTLAKVVLPIAVSQKQNTVAIDGATALVESCWPAVLATCSTFMNAALDDSYYRALIKAYQRFTQVAGLLHLNTPRDALMTTLGKAAVPPHILNAATADSTRSPVSESPRVFSNPKHLLSIESLVSQAGSIASDRDRRVSMEQARPVLTVRNLLCLRALLNLAIALGPTLENAFTVVVQVLRQADIVLSSAAMPQLSRTASSASQSEHSGATQSFSAEVAAVEAAASRLLESTADYSDEAFMNVLRAFGGMLQQTQAPQHGATLTIQEEPDSPASPQSKKTPRGYGAAEAQSKNLQFALPKLGTLAALNVSRFVSTGTESSGWSYLTEAVITVAAQNSYPANARRSAADLLCRLAAECILEIAQQDDDEGRTIVQDRSLNLLLRVVSGIYEEDGQLTNSDLEVQSHIINAVKAILEQSGDAVSAGWDKIFGILCSTFESDQGMATNITDGLVSIDWEHLSNEFVSLRLGRETFGTTQLIVNDFFSQLPPQATAAIVELLFRFMSQSEDLNLSLTAITVVWNISDQLFSSREEHAQLPSIESAGDAKTFESQLVKLSERSNTAQWTLLLVRLRQIVQQEHREPAKAAFQTLCSIAKNIGSQLPVELWALVLRHIIIGVLADEAANTNWQSRALAPTLLEGVSETIAQQIDLVTQLPGLVDIWSGLNNIIVEIVGRGDSETSTAAYQALSTVLAQVDESSQEWNEASLETLRLWITVPPSGVSSHADANQSAYRAYTRLASQLLRLRADKLDTDTASKLVTNLAACVEHSGAVTYSADAQNLSPLQNEVLMVLKAMPRSIPNIATTIVDVAVRFVSLHHNEGESPPRINRPSYVALAYKAMAWLERLILEHIDDKYLATSGAIERTMSSLAHVIEEKYNFQVAYKKIWLWSKATQVAVALVKKVLDVAETLSTEQRLEVWHAYIKISHHITHATGLQTFQDADRTFTDEHEDVQAFEALTKVLIPRLGSAWISDEDLHSYMLSLFDASLVHALESVEASAIITEPLAGLHDIRRGRVKKILPARREDMSYACFAQLLSYATSEHARLAKAAAPLLILRLAVPIRAYIADQPLRGRMPQPLSELEELQYSLEHIRGLKLNSDALEGGSRAHLRYLYPLVVQAVKVASDKRCGSREVLDPLQTLLESLVLI